MTTKTGQSISPTSSNPPASKTNGAKTISKQASRMRAKKSYKLTKIQREDIVRENIVDGISLRDLGKKYGIKFQSVWNIVNKSDKLLQYKKQAKAFREHKMGQIYDIATDVAIEKGHTLGAAQAITGAAIAWDKLHPQETVHIGDKTLNISFPNWRTFKGKKK